MRILSSLLMMGMILLLSSCSPRVATNLFKNYPQVVTPAEVLIYSQYDDVPSDSEVLGEVAVLDNGFSTRCNYDVVVALACRQTSLNGGNAFAISEHSTPSIWSSSCHQIKGVMLRIAPDIESDNTQTAALMAGDTLSDQHTPFERAREIQTREMMRRKLPRHTFYAETGYSGIYSRFILPEGCSGNPRSGLSYQFGYEWSSQYGLGAGIVYSGFRSGYDANLIGANMDVTILSHFVGPLISFKYRLDKWVLFMNIAMGWSRYQEKIPSLTYDSDGFGLQYKIGADYRVSHNTAISLTTGFNASSFKENALYQEIQGEQAGIARLFLNAGFRVYF